MFPKRGDRSPPYFGRFKRVGSGARGNRNPLAPADLFPFLSGQKGGHVRAGTDARPFSPESPFRSYLFFTKHTGPPADSRRACVIFMYFLILR